MAIRAGSLASHGVPIFCNHAPCHGYGYTYMSVGLRSSTADIIPLMGAYQHHTSARCIRRPDPTTWASLHPASNSVNHGHRRIMNSVNAPCTQLSSTVVQPPASPASDQGGHLQADMQLGCMEPQLPHGLDAKRLPHHVAFIIDGNARWARAMGLPRSEGHNKGMEELMNIIWLSSRWGLSAFTAFLFSTENWNRSREEVSSVMELFEKKFVEYLDKFANDNIKVKVIGDMNQLPQSLQDVIHKLEKKTSQNNGLKVAFAINYGGRLDIIQAFQQVATQIEQGRLKSKDVTEQAIANELWTSWMGDTQNPDLLIRTSGEQRISNFLLWQTAYSEILFLDTYFPDMNEIIYAKALVSYQKCDRRYGGRQEPLLLKS